MIPLQSYEKFVEEAKANYGRLPQETSELYKRHYIPIRQDLISIPESPSKSSVADFGVKFDAVLSTGHSAVADSRHIRIISMEEAISSDKYAKFHNSVDDKYVAYINACAKDAAIIDVPDNETVRLSIMAEAGGPLNYRMFAMVGNNANLTLLTYFTSEAEGASALSTISDISIGDDSNVEINSIHNERSGTIGIGFCKNSIGSRSHLKLNSLYNGAAHTRIRNVISASGNDSKVDVNEMIFGSSSQKFDINTFIVNSAPRTSASLESKAALTGMSFCILKGFAKINKGASKSRSYVHERGILLDRDAKVDGLPDMSVDENDVRATHSSATAPIDPEVVFYLMAKGITEAEVKSLIVAGFFAESLSRIRDSIMKEISMSLISEKLENGSFGGVPRMGIRNLWGSAVAEQDHESMFRRHYKYRNVE